MERKIENGLFIMIMEELEGKKHIKNEINIEKKFLIIRIEKLK